MRRHLVSVVLALILAPLIYIAAGYSAVKLREANDLGGSLHLGPAVLGLMAALTAGSLYALLVMARLSPLGPILTGVAYLGLTLWALIGPGSFADTMPTAFLGVQDLLYVPVGFGTTLLAVPLLFTVFSPRRWRRSAQPAGMSYQAAPNYPPSPGSAAPAYAPPTYDAPAAPAYDPPVYTPPAPATPLTPSFSAPADVQSAGGDTDPDQTRPL